MAKKTALEKLDAAIADILEEYAENVQDNIEEITTALGQKGAQALKNTSREALSDAASGEYAKGWRYEVTKTRLGATVTIYNIHPGLAHLLEHGHVTRNGTQRVYPRTPAHEHIAPVEEDLVVTFEKEVVSKL